MRQKCQDRKLSYITLWHR